MSKNPRNARQPQTKAQQKRTTAFVAVATFAGLCLVTLVAWSVTRAAAPAPAAPVAAAMQPAAGDAHDHTFETISVADAKKLAAEGKAVFLDVRSIEQYKATHIQDALHIPVTLVQGEIPYLPKDKLIVTYCTCPAEESSGHATMVLTQGGLQSKALLGGLDAWVNAGFATQVGL
jgi:rhodanese-related sulfurtransferase